MSDNEIEERVDEVEESLGRLRDNDSGMKVVSLTFEKWEFVPAEEAMEEAIQIFGALENNTTVEEVNIEHSDIVIDGRLARAIARSLAKNQSVKDVYIRCAEFRGQSEMRIVLGSLINNNRIRCLSISGYDDFMEPPLALIGWSLSRVLADVLRTTSSMERLVLVDDAINWDRLSLRNLCNGLRENRSIKKLDLADRRWRCGSRVPVWACADLCEAIGEGTKVRIPACAHQTLASLISRYQNIHELILFLHRPLDRCEWLAFAKGFAANESIKSLELVQDAGITDTFDKESNSLFEAIAHGPVEKLSLDEIPLGDVAIGIICKALCQSQSLRELELKCYMADYLKVEIPITADGASHLGHLLLSSRSLESLVIDSGYSTKVTCIGDEGAVIIANAIAERSVKTTKLSLMGCQIGNRGGRAFRDLLLLPNVKLEALDLGRNPFSLTVCKEFADCLRDNSILRSLDLRGPRDESRGVGDDARTHLIGALKTNHVLTSLFLPYGRGDSDSCVTKRCSRTDSILREVLMVNHTLSFLGCYHDDETLENYISCANRKHPVLASTMKGAPFPARLIKDMADYATPFAIERTNAVAGIDGVFSLLRQVGDGMAARASSKKRPRND